MADDEGRRALGLMIRFARQRQRPALLQSELAERADVSRSFLSQVEQGIASPTIATLERIALALGLTADELLRQAREERGR